MFSIKENFTTILADLKMQRAILIFKHFKPSKHDFSLLLLNAQNSLYDVIMLSGAINIPSACEHYCLGHFLAISSSAQVTASKRAVSFSTAPQLVY